MRMEFEEFVKLVRENMKIGYPYNNPSGKGTSEVIKYTNEDNLESMKIVYKRGSSKFYVSLKELYDGFNNKKGKLRTRDLMDENPDVFKTGKKGEKIKGHGCNCTFLFMILKEIGLVDKIKKGDTKGVGICMLNYKRY